MADFRRLVRSTPDLYLVLDLELRIEEVSEAYLRATMTTRDAIVGRNVFDVFPDNPAEPSADGVASARGSMARVLATKRADMMTVLRYPIPRPEGGFEERYWKTINTPILDDDGRVASILHRAEDVTELVRLQRERLELDRTIDAMATRSRHLDQLLDHAPDAMVVAGEDGRIQLVNVQAETLFGYARDELVGQSVDILIPERFRAGHAGHMSRFFASPLTRPMGSRLELFGRRKDASEIPIEVSLSPQRDAGGTTVSAAIRDISERRRLEAEARLSAERLRSAVESIQDAFALFDAEDRLVLCNSVFRRLVHERRDGSLVGQPFAEILDAWIDDVELPDADTKARFRADRLARRHHEPTTTIDVTMRDGRSLRITDRRTPEGGLVKTIWDVTDDEHRAAELRDARAVAEAASAAKSEFLSSMSHELRTPLNAILGFAQLLLRDKREPLTDRHRERATHITTGGEHLLRLIEDILDLSKIEAGRVTMSAEPVDVVHVLDEVHPTLASIAARHQISIELAPLPADLPMVIADRTRFVQILMNFGSNAIKYNRPSGIVRLVVSLPPGNKLRVTVVDTGFGIPVDHHDKLFQPFQRAGQETGPIEGSGIGLAITKRLAELMDGSVGFHSVPSRGSEFWVELPVHHHAPVPGMPLATRVAVAPAATGTRHLILYVEDNPANIVFMRDLMSTLDNLDLIVAPTAELGIELARARRPSLVIMDINLPGMSGLDALRVLRGLDDTRDVPVIALTAAASERDRQRGLDAGFYRYLAKPVNIDELVAAIESLLSRVD